MKPQILSSKIWFFQFSFLMVALISVSVYAQDAPAKKESALRSALRALFGSKPIDHPKTSEYECLDIVGDVPSDKEMAFFEGNWTDADQIGTMTSKVLGDGVIRIAAVEWNATKHDFVTTIETYQVRTIGKVMIGYWQGNEVDSASELDPKAEKPKKTYGFARVSTRDNSVFLSFSKRDKFASGLLTDGKLQIDRLRELEAAGKLADCFDEEFEFVRKLVHRK
jgi:hypothetical protein